MSNDINVPPKIINKSVIGPAKFPFFLDLLKEYLSEIKEENYPLSAIINISERVIKMKYFILLISFISINLKEKNYLTFSKRKNYPFKFFCF